MNIFNNLYKNKETEKEDDWGWFIQLDLDTTIPTTNANKKLNHICKTLQTIDENQEYYKTTTTVVTKNSVTKKNTCNALKTKYDFFKNLLIYGLLYNCIYLDYIYKCINPFSFYKHKTYN